MDDDRLDLCRWCEKKHVKDEYLCSKCLTDLELNNAEYIIYCDGRSHMGSPSSYESNYM